LIACTIVAAGLVPAAAQPLEIFGGYTLGRMRPDDFTRATVTGWDTAITAYVTSRIGITGDIAGYYGTAHPIDDSGDAGSLAAASVRQYSFMAGPQVRLLRTRRIETSARALIGAAHSDIRNTASYPQDQNSIAALIGSSLDIKVSRRIALRFSPGMYITHFGGQTQRTMRFGIGPVFRLGGGE
jgi:hypothetical protein